MSYQGLDWGYTLISPDDTCVIGDQIIYGSINIKQYLRNIDEV